MRYSDDHDLILTELDVRAEPFALCALKGVCAMDMAQSSTAALHYILSGEGQINMKSLPSIELSPGTLVLVPGSIAHRLQSKGAPDANSPICEPAGLGIAEHVVTGAGEGTMIVLCNTVSIDLRNTHGLIDMLRAPLSIDARDSIIVRQAMQALIFEISNPRAGSKAMVRLLMMQLVIEMLRQRLEAGDPAVLWVAGLADGRLWQALSIMLDNPGAKHSLESLADAAGMSRSKFAERFQYAYGHSPMSFLRELRMARAAQMLGDGREPVKRIAEKLGFRSRSAFTRAFTEAWGQSPRNFRSGER